MEIVSFAPAYATLPCSCSCCVRVRRWLTSRDRVLRGTAMSRVRRCPSWTSLASTLETCSGLNVRFLALHVRVTKDVLPRFCKRPGIPGAVRRRSDVQAQVRGGGGGGCRPAAQLQAPSPRVRPPRADRGARRRCVVVPSAVNPSVMHPSGSRWSSYARPSRTGRLEQRVGALFARGSVARGRECVKGANRSTW